MPKKPRKARGKRLALAAAVIQLTSPLALLAQALAAAQRATETLG